MTSAQPELDDDATWQSTQLRSQLGLILARLGRFEEAEELILESAEWVLMSEEGPPPDPANEKGAGAQVLGRAIELYEAWDTAQPGEGFDEEVQSWREERDARHR